MIDLLRALMRGVFMLAAGLLVLGVAAVLLFFTLAFVLVAWVRGVLTGRRPTWQSSWAHVQRSAASAMWEKARRTYQQQYRPHGTTSTMGQPGAQAGSSQGEVVDVEFREVKEARNPGTDAPGRIGSDGPR